MKKIRYKFITEETVEVEVDDTLGAIIEAMNEEDKSTHRAETRRHKSLEKLEQRGVQFSASNDVVAAVEHFLMHEKLYQALATLQPQQRRLLRMIYAKNRSLSDIAREEGVSPQAIHARMRRIVETLQRSL